MANKAELENKKGDWSMSAQIEAAQKRISEWPAYMREAAYFSAALVTPEAKRESDKTTSKDSAKK